MTGGQASSALGKSGKYLPGVGVAEEHIHVQKPLRKFHEENVETIKKELEYRCICHYSTT